VCADIDDFREMAAGEDMAIRFYNRGDPTDLAEQLVAILESPELQRTMAERNFEAGKEMTMTSVVKSYLRWFELQRLKRAMHNPAPNPGVRSPRPGAARSNETSSDWSLPWAFLAKHQNDVKERKVANSVAGPLQVEDAGDDLTWSNSRALEDRSNSDGD
jgi:hypothetical protein